MKRIWIPRGGYRIAAYEQPGRGPAIVLSHGLPDNHHLYDRLLPYLNGHRVVTFDFLGWGNSDKPSHYHYAFAGQEADLNAVITHLHLGTVVLVGYDPSFLPVINWVLDHPGRTASLILSNGAYTGVLETGLPAAATIFTFGQYPINAPLGPLPPGMLIGFNGLLDGLGQHPALLKALLDWQESTLFEHPADARALILFFTDQFLAHPSTYTPLRSLTSNLLDAAGAYDAARVPQLAQLGPITHIVWGAKDPDLNVRIADFLHTSMPGSTLKIQPHAHHNLMIDEPGRFASVILTALRQAAASRTTTNGGMR